MVVSIAMAIEYINVFTASLVAKNCTKFLMVKLPCGSVNAYTNINNNGSTTKSTKKST